jgi:hypothetical protein
MSARLNFILTLLISNVIILPCGFTQYMPRRTCVIIEGRVPLIYYSSICPSVPSVCFVFYQPPLFLCHYYGVRLPSLLLNMRIEDVAIDVHHI